MSDTKTENSEKIIFATKEMNKSEELSPQPATLRQMYRYVSGKYIILGIIGIINAFIAGATNPARLVIIRDTFNEVETNNARDAIADGMREKNLWFGILSGIGGITCYIFWFSFMIIGSKISYELKWRYLRAVLSQDWNWYDRQNIEELPTKINVNITEVENATGKTSGFIIYSIGAFVAGIGGAFFIGAVLACCYLIIPPFVMMWGGSRALLIMKSNQQIERAYEKSGADAEQALSSIRVVKAFGQETSEYHKFENHLSQADKSVHRFSFLYGLSLVD